MGKELSEMTLEELWILFPIILKEHNSDYKDWFNEEEGHIRNALSTVIIERISHIGSSAVKGLVSKPTIDILLEVNAEANIVDIQKLLEEAGWILMSSQIKPYLNYSFNKGYTKYGFEEKVYHLDVRHLGDYNEFYFRDYLIDHKSVAIEYAALKLELQKKYENDRDGYTDAKSEFVIHHTNKARELYGSKYKK